MAARASQARVEGRELRRVLRSLGFGPVQDAVWIAPRVSAVAVERELDPVHRGGVTARGSTTG